MKEKVVLMTLRNAPAYFLEINLPSFIVIVELQVIPAQVPELLNEKYSCCFFRVLFLQDVGN